MHFKDGNAREPTYGWGDHEVERETQEPALQQEYTEMVPESQLQSDSAGSVVIMYK